MTLVKVNNPLTRSFDGMMKELFNDLPAGFNKTVREDVLHFPPVNIYEKPDSYYLEIAAPGFEKVDFNIKLDGKVLTISTEKKETVSDPAQKLVRSEFGYKAFKRSFTVDEKIATDNISAKYENGILKLELPKKEDQKAASKEINIQ